MGLNLRLVIAQMVAATAFSAEVATSPSDLARLVNIHAPFDSQRIGGTTGPEGFVLRDCGSGKDKCSAELVTVPQSRQTIVVLSPSLFAPVFFRYIRTNDSGEPDLWAFAGAYRPWLKDPSPKYAVARLGGKPYLTITSRGGFGSDVAGAIEEWIDLTAPKFEPVLTLSVDQTWFDPMTPTEVDCTESVASWLPGPPETIRVAYRAVLKRDEKTVGSKSVTATFVRQGDKFAFAPARSTLTEKYRWGEFDIDPVTLIFH
jgi:hypothetical protein